MANDVTAHRGDHVAMSEDVTLPNVADPRTNAKAWFSLKRSATDEDAAALVQKHSDAGGGITATLSGTTATYSWTVTPDDLSEITDDDLQLELPYDFQYKGADGSVSTLRRGSIYLKEDVTRTTT